jgi:hypothetical protein
MVRSAPSSTGRRPTSSRCRSASSGCRSRVQGALAVANDDAPVRQRRGVPSGGRHAPDHRDRLSQRARLCCPGSPPLADPALHRRHAGRPLTLVALLMRWPSTALAALICPASPSALPVPIACATVRWSSGTGRTVDSCLDQRTHFAQSSISISRSSGGCRLVVTTLIAVLKSESPMSTNRDEQQASPDVQKPEGSSIEASRRHFLQFSAATSAAAVGGLVSSAAYADDDLVMAGRSNRPSWAPTKYLIDVHATSAPDRLSENSRRPSTAPRTGARFAPHSRKSLPRP